MSLYTVIPIGVLSLAAYAIAALALRFRPATAARMLIGVVAAVGLSTLALLVLVGGAFIVDTWPEPVASAGLAALLAAHGPVPAWMGIGALAAVAALVVATARIGRDIVAARRLAPPGDGVVIAADRELFAFTVEGPRPRIVLSAGLIEKLPPDELAVVLAHERSHLRHHHGTYALIGTLVGQAAPWTRPAIRRTRYLLERWADEDAATSVGDRRLVARAISRAALAGRGPTPALGFDGDDVTARVQAMLTTPSPGSHIGDTLALAGTTVATTGMAGSALQLHHALHFLS